MAVGAFRRTGLAAAVTALSLAASAALVLMARPATSGATDDLLPDLVVQRPYELYVVKHRKLRIRVSNTVANRGVGPLEISGDGTDCASSPGAGRRTMQTVFQDDPVKPSTGYFWRAHDTDFESLVAGCSRYHPAHNHWHFDNFARYTLLRERTGKVVGGSRKVSFCVIDTGRPYPEFEGSPNTAYYPRNDTPGSFGCSETSVNGLSIGWEDTYGASLPGQGIRVRKPKRARYCLVLETDPARPGNADGQLVESNEGNNIRTVKFALRPRAETLRRLGPNCRSA